MNTLQGWLQAKDAELSPLLTQTARELGLIGKDDEIRVWCDTFVVADEIPALTLGPGMKSPHWAPLHPAILKRREIERLLTLMKHANTRRLLSGLLVDHKNHPTLEGKLGGTYSTKEYINKALAADDEKEDVPHYRLLRSYGDGVQLWEVELQELF